jgi:excinuclease ABC subunit A
MNDHIIIRGAREHNLKNIDLQIPKNQLVVFTGLSGSGKSSLAFDTIYAEGQRRYVESLSSYARQFLGVMDKPDVDQIEGLSPAISIDQKSASHNPRSTVGTVTEIYDYMRLLFARIGHPHCHICGREIATLSVQQIVDQTLQTLTDEIEVKKEKIARYLILSPIIRDRKGEFLDLIKNMRQKGFTQLRVDGQIIGVNDDISLLKNNKHSIDVVIDRIIVDKTILKEPATLRTRLYDSFETAVKLSEGLCILSKVLDAAFDMPQAPKILEDHLYSQRFSCPVDNISLPEIEPRLFSFNSPHGACPTCTGLGTLLKIDEKLILNPNLTISEGGVLPYANTFAYDSWFAQKVSSFVPIRIPIKELTKKQIQLLLFGTGSSLLNSVEGKERGEVFEGLIPNLERRYKQTESDFIRTEIEKYMRKEVCPTCKGNRLKPEALSVTIAGKSIMEVTQLSISNSLDFINKLGSEVLLSDREITISTPIFKEIKERLGFLNSVGLDYLTLNRTANTLAGGEAQRIRLASQIGSGLSGVLYVLDEPSIGLHQRDNQKLIDTLKKLRDLGNSVIVVEHDREMMLQSDWLVDFGPGAGNHGGEVVSQGLPQHVIDDPKSITGKYLSGKKQINISSPSFSKEGSKGDLVISGVSQHNLKNVTAEFPLGKFICIAGVSGSGKSTLLVDVLYHALAQKFNPDHKEKPGNFEKIYIKPPSTRLGEGGQGGEVRGDRIETALNRVIMVDQSPIGRTPRSNPATYTGLFTPIRDIFSLVPEARVRGYQPGRFSFNVRGGRCENCQGEGQIKIEMQFLPNVYVNCEVCHGTRYNSETLEVRYKDKNISEVLNMTVEQGLEFFRAIPAITEKLQTLIDVGLNYIRLGQPAPTLSGGEAQRVKLSSELSKRTTGKTLYILDEPTTGLHFADLEKLLHVLTKLVEAGNTVIVIEHNLDVIKNADWIIELGPEGGDKGGYIVAQGTPSHLAKISTSPTGKYL